MTKAFAALAATLGWAALIIQFCLLWPPSSGKSLIDVVINYFSFFTILTNILVALALSVPLLNARSAVAEFFSRATVQTAIATSIAVELEDRVRHDFLLACSESTTQSCLVFPASSSKASRCTPSSVATTAR